MPRDIEYIRRYIGPVFFVEKKSIEFGSVSRNIESCPNTDCPQHQKPVLGLPHHCFECGSKIVNVRCERKFEKLPDTHLKDFYDKCIGLSNQTFNGVRSFMEPNVTFFADNSHVIYVPRLGKDEENFAIIDNKTFGHYCINSDCIWHERYVNTEHNYCQECGGKLHVNITHNVTGIMNEYGAVDILDSHSNKNYDHFKFIEHQLWTHFVETYSKTKRCKELIRVIEKTYGEGCVSMRSAFVSYHSHY